MKPSIANTLDSIKALISKSVDVEVFLGAPDDSVPGVYVFPFHLSEVAIARRRSLDRQGQDHRHQYVIQCMLVVSPSTDFETLGRGLDCLQDNPVVESANGGCQIAMSSASAEDQNRVFSAAGILQRLAVGFEVRMGG
ncbi:MAG: hypothetical protein HQ519_13710 [Planctomycetes bacterium]|nr:hypothetical protein [Planctomycetota bacterium]